jgi:hypothetical protein
MRNAQLLLERALYRGAGDQALDASTRAVRTLSEDELQEAFDLMRGAHVEGGSVKGSWSTLAGWAVHTIGRGLLHESDPHDLEARHHQAQQLKMLLGERRGKAVPMRIHQAIGLVVPIAAALRGLSRLEQGLAVGDADALSCQVLSLRSRWRRLDPLASRTRLRRVTRLVQRASEHVRTEATAGRVPPHVVAWMQRAVQQWVPASVVDAAPAGRQLTWSSDEED